MGKLLESTWYYQLLCCSDGGNQPIVIQIMKEKELLHR